MRRTMLALAALAIVAAACGGQEPTTAGSPSGTPSGTSAPATAAGCASQNAAALTNAGQLTIGTDNPAYPPWYAGGGTKGTGWKINNPATGKGFESAVAYAVADRLGFTKDQVQWTVVPFDQAFKPGAKPFDFDINQISITPKRAQAVDFSQGYYDVSSAVVAVGGTPIAKATSVSDLRQYRLATQIGTTDYDLIVNVIQPTPEAGAYNTLNDAVQALKAGQVDGIVVDLPTAFYMAAVQVPDGVIVGQFPADASGAKDQFGMTFTKGSPLVACVNQALDELKADGTLQAIQDRWLAGVAGAPVFSMS